jgi:hypothetical protein
MTPTSTSCSYVEQCIEKALSHLHQFEVEEALALLYEIKEKLREKNGGITSPNATSIHQKSDEMLTSLSRTPSYEARMNQLTEHTIR